MARRRGSRRLALDILYERDLTEAPVQDIMSRYVQEPAYEFAALLVEGVQAHRAELDELISSYALDWTIERMPVIDRNLLRLGVYEILYVDDVPPAVTINEAVELAKRYSTEDSSRFINGILGRIAEKEPTRA